MSDSTTLRAQLAALPTGPGVYIYRDDADRVLYVGKAKSLRKRVLSYFQAPLRPGEDVSGWPMTVRSGLHPKTGDLVGRIASVETFVTGSESEALILEANLVKRHRPPFNVRLRDDKSYPYIGISLDEDYPRVYFTREKHRRDRLYFGPFSNAYKVRETLNLIGKIFPSRPCEGREPGRPSGVPCLDYHIKRCLAPCVGYISKDEYRALIDKIIAFLSGRYRGLERELEAEMRGAAVAQEFERAAAIRNRLQAMRHLMERQFATAGSVGTADVLGIAVDGESANVQVLQVRDGVLQDRQSFFLDVAGEEDEAEVLVQFAYEYYAMALAIPTLVVLPQDSAAGPDLEALLSDRRGSRVEARAASRGDKRKLAELATRNARFALDQDQRRHEQARGRRREALADLRERLDLPAPPLRIECYDISNLGETYAVASMVVFEDGAPAKSHYRTFTMRYDGGPDDFTRMQEALRRRFARLLDPEDDPSFAARPGLVVIDGGKGQLAAAMEGMREAGVSGVPIVSLAKKREEVFRPGRSDPLLLDEGSSALRVLQHIRDEAHRFALRHHRNRRGRGMTESVLDALPGVGPARKAAILRHFGSTDRFLSASREELEAVPGVPSKVARDVYDRLHRTAGPREAAPVAGGRGEGTAWS
ncbi:excinuclease ABC subunit UvrC [Miltoncostaea oceani]|uniref:excinuclease ABC subunit UvrC n=1 Tax=Miltoncostaea oceani TaxID=2843216 RepID=UPI001C3C1F24|nr:excinuclease ABC subunit UvrC [Miltoncostaea oceani]